jgi:hypothetical protein
MTELNQPVFKFYCVKCREEHPFRLGCRVWQDMKKLMAQHVDIDLDCWSRDKRRRNGL